MFLFRFLRRQLRLERSIQQPLDRRGAAVEPVLETVVVEPL